MVDLVVSSGSVTTTEDHHFWNVTDQAWQESQHLDVGDQLRSADGTVVTVEGLNWATSHYSAAYDLTVDDLHTFYVTTGNTDVLVHNTSCLDASLLGNQIGSGGQKLVFEYGDDLAVGIRDPGSVNPIDFAEEIQLLNQLEGHGIPVVAAELATLNGQPAILYSRYAAGSKEILNGSQNLGFLNGGAARDRMVADLTEIRRAMETRQVGIDDLQFLVGADGSVVVSDPLGIRSSLSDRNRQIFEQLINLVTGAG